MDDDMINNILTLAAIDQGIVELVDKFLAAGYNRDDIANALHHQADVISPPNPEPHFNLNL